MPKQFKYKIDLSLPASICIVYPLAVLIIILVFRMFFPDISFYNESWSTKGVPVLKVFSLGNSLTRGILDFILIFPAVFVSAQFIPFRRVPPQKNDHYQRFSPGFFKLLKPQLVASIAATIIYGLLFLIIRPIAADYQVDIQTKSILFAEAKEKALLCSNRAEWAEASRYMSICERIWPKNKELAGMRELITAEMARIVYNRGTAPESDTQKRIIGIPGQPGPVDLQSALLFAETALREERYYDAHYLATIAGRLASQGSNEAARASRLSVAAWNAIESLEPSAAEREQSEIYQQKRDGYEAMNSGDWVRAYYIFRELSVNHPDDPDVKKFFALSAEGVEQVAFFIDEMNMRLGIELVDTIFSLPLFETDGRMVMRFASLSSSADYIYGKGLEIAAFDDDQNPLYSVESPYVKLLPFYIGDQQFTVMYLQAFNRNYEQINWGPAWTGSPPAGTPKTQLVLAISYEDFLLASLAGRPLDGFFLSDIWALASRMENYGYVPEVYQAEIINSVIQPLLFLPLMMFSLTIGWILRCKKHRSFSILPMFILMPVILTVLINLLRDIVSNSCVFAVVSFGFSTALAIGFAAAMLLFVLGIVCLAAQRS
ncbi:MAG: hypothetical protein LBB22_03400 [Treponema sp.]|jgi:hypothetical protein|nr:hypothetical protein [Treponema sp.]